MISEKIRKEQISNFRESVTDGQRIPRKSVQNRYKMLENPSQTGKILAENPCKKMYAESGNKQEKKERKAKKRGKKEKQKKENKWTWKQTPTNHKKKQNF
jgi:hypothetical protein